ncbi:MAG: ubiquinone biosynthesis regulatory protein kinase UbiB [Gammaproteobacteria bacterium]|nr:MAG: ubiquinone biosynthesis regulatory protein kinase UbiB [Gammaproteobacteria bacterium]
MRYLRLLFRIFHINLVLFRHGLEEVLLNVPFFRPIRFILFLMPWHWFRKLETSHGARIRRALEDLGPIFVKFGQALSTRRDLLPEDIADELAKLQDQVPPFDGAIAQEIIEKALKKPVSEAFSEFSVEPLASASIAQVHCATLHDGKEVVVKVLRPGVEKSVRKDLELMHALASIAHRYWEDGRRLRPKDVVDEYEQVIMDELDLMREAANASQLRKNFENSTDLYVPEVYFDLCHRNVMVMERIHGIPVNDMKALREHGVNLQKLSDRGSHIFFTQVFSHNFFHADMHPGNIFVSYENPEDPKYIGVDFGIMGTLALEDQRYLAENLLAFLNADYRRVAELHLESGWVPPDTRVDQFESAIRTVCEPIFQRPLSEISFGSLLLRLFQTARRFNMEVQPQLVLLQKTLLNIEGLGRTLDPDLDLWKTAKPFLDRWMSEQVGPRALASGLRKQLPRLAERLPEMPDLIYNTLKTFEQGQTRLEMHSQELIELRKEIKNSNRNLLFALALGFVGVIAAMWFF